MELDGGACRAPSAALYLRPDGWVAVCCASWHLLGRVTGPERQSLEAIWGGHAAETQRLALDRHDFSLGCWECGQAIARGERESAVASSYDDLDGRGASGYPQMIDFAMSNRCNLQCVMCNGGLSSTIRRRREGRPPLPPAYDDRFFDELDPFLLHLRRAVFKGGEPFLIPEHLRVWDRMIELDLCPDVYLTTNGTVLTPEVERYVESLRMRVSISIDAIDPVLLGEIRVGVDAGRLWSNMDRLQAISERTGRTVGMTFCLMSNNWHELVPFLLEADRRGATPDVIVVDGPRKFGVASLARPQLEQVADHLDRTGGRADLSAASRGLLDRAHQAVAAAMITALDRESAQSVTITRSTTDGVAARRAELSELSRLEPLEITYRDSVAVSVNEPGWASWLDPTGWVGTGVDELVGVLAGLAGGALRSEVETVDDGVRRVWFTDDGVDHPWRLLAYYVPSNEALDREVVLIAPLDASLAASTSELDSGA